MVNKVAVVVKNGVFLAILAVNFLPGSEFDQTWKIGDNRYLIRIYSFPVSFNSAKGESLKLMSDSVKRCYPDDNTYWTGSLAKKGNQYSKSSGTIRVSSQPSGGSEWWYQGWFKFNLSAIPDSSTIDTVAINFYCSNRSQEIPYAYVRLLPGDPVSADDQTLWTWLTTGSIVTSARSIDLYWQTRGLNAIGKAAVESCLGQNWIAFGLHEFSNRTGAWAEVKGHGSGENTPYLEIAYTLPARSDISMEEILEPAFVVPVGTIIVPTGRWRNRQPHPDNYNAWFIFINPAGQRTTLPAIQVLGQRGEADTVLYFTPFPLNDTGLWTVKCSTYAENDIDPNNDIRERYFRVVQSSGGNHFDVAVTEITSPVGVIDTSTAIIPRARWRNQSSNSATFFAYCALVNPEGVRIYTNSVLLSNFPGSIDTTIEFTPYNVGHQTGQWAVICSTVALGDTNPDNDWRWGSFNVAAGGGSPKGWHEVSPVPLPPSSKAVKDGGWLTYDQGTGLFFIAKGNKTGDFYCYDPVADTWRELCLWPGGIENKGPAKGATGAADGMGHVFAIKGNNTLGFWCYYINGDSWHQLRDVPAGPSGKKIKGGSDMVVINQSGNQYVYLLKGYKNEFYRYHCDGDSWEQLPDAPQALHPKWDKGSWLAYDGNRYIYAHKAKYHEFWRFDLYTATWDTHRLKGIPFLSRTGKNKKAKDGSSGAYLNGAVFALKGGNTCEFYLYEPEGDTWTELEPMPEVGSTGKKKRVKGGGDLVAMGENILYALKGNKTRELWYYCYIPETQVLKNGVQTEVTTPVFTKEQFRIFPSPTTEDVLALEFEDGICPPLPLKGALYDNAGKLVQTFAINSHNATLNFARLPAGIYWLALENRSGVRFLRKIIIAR